MRRDTLEEVIFELQQNGAYMRVAAIDAATGIEVSVVGSASSPQSMLQNAAMRKLRYVLENGKGPARPERGIKV